MRKKVVYCNNLRSASTITHESCEQLVKMILLVLVASQLFACVCGHQERDKNCATLFSKANYAGDSLPLRDFDQSANLRREYRQNLEGWQGTGSIKVQNNCLMTVCSESYFLGTCSLLTTSVNTAANIPVPVVLSANCTCRSDCSCADIVIPEHDAVYGEHGRAFLGDTCNACDTEYISLAREEWFPKEYANSVGTLVVRPGCKLTLFSKPGFDGEKVEITKPFHQGFNGTIASYRFSCGDAAKKQSHHDQNGPPLMTNIPATKDALLKMISSDSSLSKHPGVKFALQTAEKGRSPRNVHLVIIGHYKPSVIGLTQCAANPANKIGYGLKLQLNVITVPVGGNSDMEDDFELIASLSDYLYTNEELSSCLPNAVVVYHWIGDKDYAVPGSAFQRKLEAIRALRTHLLDLNYSNVIFLLFILPGQASIDEKQPDDKISQFEEEILKEWKFPEPVRICVKVTKQPDTRYVDGYLRMENGEYWPRNLQVNLVDMCKNVGDWLGEYVIREAYRDEESIRSRIEQTIHEIPPEDIEIKQLYETTALSMDQEMGRFFFWDSASATHDVDDVDDDKIYYECVRTERELNQELEELQAELKVSTRNLKIDRKLIEAAIIKKFGNVPEISENASIEYD